jgi:recombination protein U
MNRAAYAAQGRAARKAGGDFESYLLNLFELYSNYGIMHVEKTPEPMKIIRPAGPGQFLACFEKSAQPDFKGTLRGGRTIVLEAKHTDADRILQSALTDNERDELATYYRMGAVAGVIVSFGLKKFCYVPYIAWAHMEQFAGYKHIKAADYGRWEAPFLSGYDQNVKEYIQTVDKNYQSAYTGLTIQKAEAAK